MLVSDTGVNWISLFIARLEFLCRMCFALKASSGWIFRQLRRVLCMFMIFLMEGLINFQVFPTLACSRGNCLLFIYLIY